jgi:hypothetical protein
MIEDRDRTNSFENTDPEPINLYIGQKLKTILSDDARLAYAVVAVTQDHNAQKGCEMAKNKHDEAAQGVTRRDVIKGVGAGAAGLALTRNGPVQAGEVHGIDSAREPHVGEAVGESESHESQPAPDDVEEVLGFISPTYAIPFKIRRV